MAMKATARKAGAPKKSARTVRRATVPAATATVPKFDARTAAELEKRMRKLCLSMPEATERISHGSPNFFFKDKRAFLSLLVKGHHQNQFPHFWCAAPLGMQEDLIGSDPNVFFRPPYVGGMGWVGVRLDRGAPWPLVERVVTEAYNFIATKTKR